MDVKKLARNVKKYKNANICIYKKQRKKVYECKKYTNARSPWELMDPWTKNYSVKSQDIRMPDSMFLVY